MPFDIRAININLARMIKYIEHRSTYRLNGEIGSRCSNGINVQMVQMYQNTHTHRVFN